MSDWKNIYKNKLEERELNPTSDAWERMNSLLDENSVPKKNGKPIRWILGIAASLAILIGVWLAIQPSQKVPNEMNTVKIVKTNLQNKIIKKDSKKSGNQYITKSKETEKLVVLQPKISEKDIESIEKINTEHQSIAIKNEPKSMIVVPIKYESLDTLPVMNLNVEKSTESYLAEAIQQQRSIESQKITVNQNILLNRAEDEVFKKNSPDILERFTSRLKQAQLALAERNNK